MLSRRRLDMEREGNITTPPSKIEIHINIVQVLVGIDRWAVKTGRCLIVGLNFLTASHYYCRSV